jgi:protein phosphatase
MSCYLSIEPDPFPARPSSGIAVHVCARTDRGLERPNNEDRAAFADLSTDLSFEPPAAQRLGPGAAFVALVCDGMGGEAGGEIASRLAVETIVPYLRATWREGFASLAASLEAASARIKEAAQIEPAYGRMGTTATLGAIVNRSLVCAQVGDSRAYVLRRGVLTQITRDQTLAELLRRSGSEADEVVGSNVILQAVGSSVRLDVAITHTPLEDDDTLLLCSDGLSGVVPDSILAATLAAASDPESACDTLITRALERGAPDNVTCIVVRLGEQAAERAHRVLERGAIGG